MDDTRILRIVDGILDAIASGFEDEDSIFDEISSNGTLGAYNVFTDATSDVAKVIVEGMVKARLIPRG